ncbi:hypothetical protein H920_01626 [Fukomys damarensis]|uniref:Uncharacterized protein n=1 Tax=Fukomys damarensis TaxID=885580 RepID=A0A091DXY0_FUKDA|nr:hypothetical protein H920_01626 [Fukomys damarensis]
MGASHAGAAVEEAVHKRRGRGQTGPGAALGSRGCVQQAPQAKFTARTRCSQSTHRKPEEEEEEEEENCTQPRLGVFWPQPFILFPNLSPHFHIL